MIASILQMPDTGFRRAARKLLWFQNWVNSSTDPAESNNAAAGHHHCSGEAGERGRSPQIACSSR
jgi:hypothetical protein